MKSTSRDTAIQDHLPQTGTRLTTTDKSDKSQIGQRLYSLQKIITIQTSGDVHPKIGMATEASQGRVSFEVQVAKLLGVGGKIERTKLILAENSG